MSSKRRIPQTMRKQVRERARGFCEYCLVHEDDMVFPFEADHIVAEKHTGATTLINLAWACGLCNRFKGSDIASIDPVSTKVVPLYNPRQHYWKRHFRLNGARIEPLTASARATTDLLHLNSVQRLGQRLGLLALGRYPLEDALQRG